jgi:hypothetical protein
LNTINLFTVPQLLKSLPDLIKKLSNPLDPLRNIFLRNAGTLSMLLESIVNQPMADPSPILQLFGVVFVGDVEFHEGKKK